jgi:hypothetical protein
MPLHLVGLTPSLASIAKFVGTQMRSPAKRALGIDPMSKALHKGVQSFLSAFEAEYERREPFATLLEGAAKESVSAFIHSPAGLDALARAFTDAASLGSATLAGLWGEIRKDDGSRLIDLPSDFDWGMVRSEYLEAVKAIKSATPELRDAWTAENLDRLTDATEALRGVAPRFSLEKYRSILLQEYGTLKLSAIHADYDPRSSDRTIALQRIYVQPRVKEAFPPRNLSRDYRRRLEVEARLFGAGEETECEHLALEYERAPVRPLRDALTDESYQRVVVLGDPRTRKVHSASAPRPGVGGGSLAVIAVPGRAP